MGEGDSGYEVQEKHAFRNLERTLVHKHKYRGTKQVQVPRLWET